MSNCEDFENFDDSHQPAAFSVSEFLDAYSMSRKTLFKLWKENRGPRFYRVGNGRSKIMIPASEAAAWQRRMVEETEAADWRTRQVADEIRAAAEMLLAQGYRPEAARTAELAR